MRFEEIEGINFNVGSITRSFEKKGQQEFFRLGLHSKNGKKDLIFLYPKKVGDMNVIASSCDMDKVNGLYGLTLIHVQPVQTRLGAGLTIIGKSSLGVPIVHSLAVWFIPEEPGTFLSIDQLTLQCVDRTKDKP